MPPISSGKVLVSGANGFIAAWVIRSLLEEGFSVRGAVRSAMKGIHLCDMFASHGDKFELVVVPDMAQEGAFDEAVKGVDAIEHTATPTNFNDEPETLIAGAIQGTVGILQSALKHGYVWESELARTISQSEIDSTSVKRVVVTSSTSAVTQTEKWMTEEHTKVFNERDWNEEAPNEVAAVGRAPGMTKYRASKALAERAAWDFVQHHKSELGWDLVVLNPPNVFGPHINDASTPDALRTTSRLFYTMLTKPSSPALQNSGRCWIDVRDLGRAHVLALLKAAASGERIIVSAGPYVWQDWLDAAPDNMAKYQKGVPGSGKDAVHRIIFDVSKAARVLGMTTYRGIEETARDTLADWEARGW